MQELVRSYKETAGEVDGTGFAKLLKVPRDPKSFEEHRPLPQDSNENSCEKYKPLLEESEEQPAVKAKQQ